MKIKKKIVGRKVQVVEQVERVRYAVRLDAKSILALLREVGVELPGDDELGGHTSVTFRVPSGGDWANEEVELDADERDGDQVVTVSWVVDRRKAKKPR